jgi:hypothetical protein
VKKYSSSCQGPGLNDSKHLNVHCISFQITSLWFSNRPYCTHLSPLLCVLHVPPVSGPFIDYPIIFRFFLVVKGPAADATDAPQPWGFLCNPMMKMMMMIIIFFFCPFPSNGAPVEWKLTGENRSTRRKTCPSATLSTTNPTWTDPGSNPSLRGGRPATNRLNHGTA